jgi:hypothetical protein
MPAHLQPRKENHMPRTPNPVAAEATGEKLAVEFRGATYTVDAAGDWDLEVLEALEDGKMTTAVRALLGPDQFAAFKATRPKVNDLNDLFEAIQTALGIQGN